MDYTRENLKWNGWGWRDKVYPLGEQESALRQFLLENLSVNELTALDSCSLEALETPASRLTPALSEELSKIVGTENLRTDHYERVFHAVGRSYPDLIKLNRGEITHFPDAVIYPGTSEEIAQILSLCSKARFAVVPFGGGSSVVGGVEASAGGLNGIITLDTTRLDQILKIDPVSRTATVQAGIYGPRLEEALNKVGFTLGHYPQSFEFSTLGGWIAARGAGQQSNRYGHVGEFLLSAEVITPAGTFKTKSFPASAAGPNLNEIIAGSEGVLGIITEATVALHPVPEKGAARAFIMPSWEAGLEAVRKLVHEKTGASMVRLSDYPETYFFSKFRSLGRKPGLSSWFSRLFKRILSLDEPCVLLVGTEGSRNEVKKALRSSATVIRKCKGIPVGSGPAGSWSKERFETPYLRDQLLAQGVGVDTLETSTVWSNMGHLHAAVTKRIEEAIEKSSPGNGKGIVMCHISHSYLEGASLYFTFLFPMDGEDPLSQWKQIKRAASDTISREGGTISHHHGVGVDHVPWMTAEKGEVGIDLLKGAKDRLDPKGIMNPGKLLPNTTAE